MYRTAEDELHNRVTEKWSGNSPRMRAYCLNMFYNNASSDMDLSQENRSTWSLNPYLGKRSYVHQKKAFRFLRRNVAGSTTQSDQKMDGFKFNWQENWKASPSC